MKENESRDCAIDRSPPHDPDSTVPSISGSVVPEEVGALVASVLNSGKIKSHETNIVYMVKPPKFCKVNPSLWFKEVEAIFANFGIRNDETKFRYVVIHLDQSVLLLILDMLEKPPERNKYKSLKNRIILLFDESDESKLKRLIGVDRHDKEKPSEFLERLKSIAAGKFDEAVLKTVFLEQMPENIQNVLEISGLTDLSELVQRADNMVEVTQRILGVYYVDEPIENDITSTFDEHLKVVEEMIDYLARDMKQTELCRRSRYRKCCKFFKKAKEKLKIY
ncbi:PREDICTED: uncharacterized protein LOC108771361 [Cyphomyrmex costatus]|uniref:uncharacterized protein LOC108771361 n=1 Tax=Cyphomyrmex costatus TaxID=456900 RepID=UPI0008523918|nr:PREDICTED: uncharacterized protein LOC108771361 [Cyphomyrmex costatus]XP_018392129.1 PREDICTED: uncharacterized protein LOC108771361 [Cyphomyrmex costatus]XP_018392130.1 PREDICTED: uncharacterized protein LOC108771361 [Cyphomyrmex costatus]XP_018392131.1 PREDICTED: uncharacterized protein LOC108771361 [Cyphomyrmex costatus]